MQPIVRTGLDTEAGAPAVFETVAPRLRRFYARCHAAILEVYPDLPRISDSLPFAAVTVNFGPQTVLNLHRDWKNLAFGWCLLYILGDYDHTKGGHLILWELKLILEVRPGDLVFLPSACITHGNIPLASADETRYSVAWYTAGGLFAWVRAGYSKQAEWKARDPHGFEEFKAFSEERWEDGLKLYGTREELSEQGMGGTR